MSARNSGQGLCQGPQLTATLWPQASGQARATASVHPRDAQYKLHWDGGDQPSNACAAYGYLIGKAMGTHRAYADANAPAGG